MALKITCPHCGSPIRLQEPFPLPGAERQCTCGRTLSITYPVGMMDALRRRGALFQDDVPPTVAAPAAPAPPTVNPAARAPNAPAPRAASPVAQAARPPAPPPPPARPAEPEPSLPGPLRPVTGEYPRSGPHDETTAFEYRPPGPDDPTVARSEPRRVPVPPTTAPTVQVRPGRAPTPAANATPGKKAPIKKKVGWGRRLLQLGGFAGVLSLGLLVLAVAAVLGVGWWYSRDLPSPEALRTYRPPTVTTVYDRNHALMGEIYDERRYVVPLDQIPRLVQEAFISAEDASFRTHGGVDYMGILRAVGRNALEGRKAQGASTITQQVTRNFLLSNEKTFSRKIREILLSWRIEDTFDKDHILFLYLNEIYLGSHAYGVEAASRVYFGKHVGELNLAEAALLAGLPQRPSDYSPHRHFDKAKQRQKYVLGQMVDNGVVTKAEADAAEAAPIEIVERTNEYLREAPWFTDHVHQYVPELLAGPEPTPPPGLDEAALAADTGWQERRAAWQAKVDDWEQKMLHEGLEIETTCDLVLQKEGQRAVTNGVTAVDERKGWRGTETVPEAEIAAAVAALPARQELLLEGERYAGIVIEVKKKHLVVDLRGGQALVPLSRTTWASPEGSRAALADLTQVFHRGDKLTVELVKKDATQDKAFAGYTEAGPGPFASADIWQAPDLEGALYSYRLDDGGVLAMVGGVDFVETKFNRALQAQRQVGSTFKPIVYAAAIESKQYTTGSIVPDRPLAFNTAGGAWKPENYGGSYMGDITLRRALALSRNTVTVQVLERIGVDPVIAMGKRLGIESTLEPELAMGLGAASLSMPELTRAYSAFATGGHKVEPHTVTRVKDRDGNILYEWTKPAAGWEQVLDPGVAGIMNWMLVEVATAGTAAKAQSLGIHVAGKTGTTNDNKDVWFVGFNPDIITSVWVGYDQPRTITSNATGGHVSLPIWMEYMKKAAPKDKDRPFPPATGITWIEVDEATGRPMAGGRSMPFLPGTGPTGAPLVAGQTSSEDLLTQEF